MRILLIAGGAREHAIAQSLSRSSHAPDIVAIGTKKIPGIAALSSDYFIGSPLDHAFVLNVARTCMPDFCFIGPDDPIGSGLADALASIGVPSVAPHKALARIESSKGFARQLMQKYEIDFSPKFRVFTSSEYTPAELNTSLQQYIEDDLRGEYVVKYDALFGGKGVKVSGIHLDSLHDGIAFARECMDDCGTVVIEEKLVGVEFSYHSFVSGSRVVHMPAVQDHKLAYEGDTGPNTGGMGTYSCADHSLPFLTPSDISLAGEINARVARALMEECGAPYKGILYGGFMAVQGGIRVIEYNARFGDPESLNMLSILSTDFVDICLSIIDGSLDASLVAFEKKATVCKYVVPESYPVGKEQSGMPLTLPHTLPQSVRLYTGDIAVDTGSGTITLGSSRAVGVVGIADTLSEAERAAETVCKGVVGPVRWRSDIGTDALIHQRVATLAALRCEK